MSKTFKDPCLLESPKSFKLLNSTVAGDNQYRSIPKKSKKPASGYSQTANPKSNNDLKTMQAALAGTIKPYDKAE